MTALVAAVATVPALALSVDEVVLLVALPLMATWVGLAGIGVIEEQPFGMIARKFIGSVMLGGMAGIVALAAIEATGARGYLAMFLTLAIGMGALSIARKLRSMGGQMLDPLWNALGFERKPSGDDIPRIDPRPMGNAALDKLVDELNDEDKADD